MSVYWQFACRYTGTGRAYCQLEILRLLIMNFKETFKIASFFFSNFLNKTILVSKTSHYVLEKIKCLKELNLNVKLVYSSRGFLVSIHTKHRETLQSLRRSSRIAIRATILLKP